MRAPALLYCVRYLFLSMLCVYDNNAGGITRGKILNSKFWNN